ncbi:hypothetical protein [Arenimonas sp. GDDSR-1]|uniref:hypothetical protein n=1 Tax=Arenimonas sp. GDDSR-1 TaxID=2950125 RepID=UPI00261BFAAE|nr:hypothetical protein [Arenimonas sp. GDDSR-1]
MHPSLRLALALVAGIAAALFTIMLIETVGHRLYPPPALDYSDTEALRAYVAGLPIGAKLIVLSAWLAGTVDGVFVAGLVNRARFGLCAAVIGALVLAATLANLAMIPHPLWLALAGVIGIPLCAWMTARLLPRLLKTA